MFENFIAFASGMISSLLLIYGTLGIIVYGSPFNSTEAATKRARTMDAHAQKLYFEVRQINLILAVGMVLAGFFIANW
jgi:uncharacterized membrane protein YidH (DUF202 family)